MKVYRYQFTRLTKIFIYIGMALCVIGFGINIYTLLNSDIASSSNIVYPIIQYAIMFLIPVLLLNILISLLVSSYYSIDGNILKTSFGIIKSKYNISDITSVVLDRTTNKLSVYFENNSFIVIVVKEEWYNDFVDALLKANTGIEYSIKSKDPEPPENGDKK